MSDRGSPDIIIRPLASQEDFRRCVDLQYEIWGEGFGECAPPSLLLAVQEVGGIAAGAFDAHGRLLGFVFGISGLRDGRPAHWSDMLAVREEARGSGLGIRLKAYQRERLLELGIGVAFWSYDPLEARNAHININRLGARPIEYVRDMYGDVTGSRLHAGLGTDRFVVEWELRDPRVESALADRSSPEPGNLEDAPIVNVAMESDGAIVPVERELPDHARVRVAIPHDIQRVKADSIDRARSWRSSTRRTFLHYLDHGYAVVGFVAGPPSSHPAYLLKGGQAGARGDAGARTGTS
jgi:predicted GNAT superfamily acetyltransferase